MTTHVQEPVGQPADPDFSGVENAMRRARRNATQARFKTIPSKRLDIDLSDSLDRSKNILIYVADRLTGLKIPGLPDDKRLQLAMACQHVAIEHAQSIVVLVDEKLYGSALALKRPLFEAYVRGIWLRYAATDDQVERAGRDCFPTFNTMATDIPPMRRLKDQLWNDLCSYTHAGYMQIGARLSVAGLCSNYEPDEISAALHWADMLQLSAGIELAGAANNEHLAKLFLERMKRQT